MASKRKRKFGDYARCPITMLMKKRAFGLKLKKYIIRSFTFSIFIFYSENEKTFTCSCLSWDNV